jgi:hypothetical protein
MIAPETGCPEAGNARCLGLRAVASLSGLDRNLRWNSIF